MLRDARALSGHPVPALRARTCARMHVERSAGMVEEHSNGHKARRCPACKPVLDVEALSLHVNITRVGVGTRVLKPFLPPTCPVPPLTHTVLCYLVPP